MLRLVDDLSCPFARLAHDDLGTLICRGQVFLALLSGGKSCCDLARTLIHRPQDHRPYEFHREPDEDDEDEHLHDQREIDIHYRLLTSVSGGTFTASNRK